MFGKEDLQPPSGLKFEPNRQPTGSKKESKRIKQKKKKKNSVASIP
jgi:hypothetical protein